MPDEYRSLKYYTLFGFFVIGIVTVLLGQVLPILIARLALNDAEAGVLLSAQFAGALVGTVIVGRMIRRFGFAIASVTGVGLMIVGLPGLNATSFVACWIGIFVYGMGIGISIPAINLWTIEVTAPEKQSSTVNLLNFAWGLGAICSRPFVALVAGETSVAAVTLPIVGALLAVAVCFLSGVRRWNAAASDGIGSVSTGNIWRRPEAWLFLLFSFFMIGVEGGVHGWLTTYSESLRSSAGPAVNATVVYFGFYVLGRGIASFISRRMSENTLISICSVILVFGVFLIVVSENLILVGAAVAGLGSSAIFPTNMVRFAKIFGPTATRHATPIFLAGTFGAATISSLVGFVSYRLESLRAGIVVILISAALVVILQWAISVVFRQTTGSSSTRV